MGQKKSKSQVSQLRKIRKEKKIKRMERQDALGISRKKRKLSIPPKVFIILKIVSIVSIPVCYLIYSPLLILCVLFSISMFVFACLTENHMNHTFVKSNHIKILKVDSIVAVILLIIVIVSIPVTLNSKKELPFGGFKNSFTSQVESIGSCLTGQRSIFRWGGYGMKFGMKDFPEGMPDFGDFKGEFPGEFPSDMPIDLPENMGDFKPPMNFNKVVKDLPVEAVFSQIISSINTILLFSISLLSLYTLLVFNKKRNNFDKVMNEEIIDELPDLNEVNFEELFLFGYVLSDE